MALIAPADVMNAQNARTITPYNRTAPPALPVAPVQGFFSRIPGCFAYPVKHGGLMRLIFGAVVLWVGALAAMYGARGLILTGPILGYFATYLLDIANESGDGKDEIPNWPSFDFELAANFTMLNLTILLSVLPVGLYLAAMYFYSLPFEYLIIPIYFSAFFLPMAMIRVCMIQSLEGVLPLPVLTSICKVPTAYFGLCLVMTALLLIQVVVVVLCGLIPYAGMFLNALVSFYFMILSMRVLGLFYFIQRERLDWFSHLTRDL